MCFYKEYCQQLMENTILFNDIKMRDVIYNPLATSKLIPNIIKENEIWENVKRLSKIINFIKMNLYIEINIYNWFETNELNLLLKDDIEHTKGNAIDFKTNQTINDFEYLKNELQYFTNLRLVKTNKPYIHLDFNGENKRIINTIY
jgi:hypothetical protein